MRLYNKSKRIYQHSFYNKENKLEVLNLKPGQNADIPADVAKLWLETGDVVEYVDPKEAKAKEAKAEGEKKALQKENEDLKAKIAQLEAEAKAKEAKAEGEKTSKDKQ